MEGCVGLRTPSLGACWRRGRRRLRAGLRRSLQHLRERFRWDVRRCLGLERLVGVRGVRLLLPALPLRLDFHSDTDTVDDVKAKCNWLERLTQPSKQGRKNVKVIFGDLFEDEKWVVSSVNIEYSLFDMPSGFLPRQAYATIQLQQEK